MSFIYKRIVRFQDTDAAGVVYFASVLTMCHEAYEESLAVSGINLKAFFSNPDVAIPIVHASVDFFQPMFCGDQIFIHLIPKQIASEKVEIAYQIVAVSEKLIAKAITKHICIEPISKTRKAMPAEMIQWLQQWGV
jgi:1,4-dihydroxy-2-naphthoyl-CoA hydrolase